jgi:hypothetical protein
MISLPDPPKLMYPSHEHRKKAVGELLLIVRKRVS